jgi:hypothetical protein
MICVEQDFTVYCADLFSYQQEKHLEKNLIFSAVPKNYPLKTILLKVCLEKIPGNSFCKFCHIGFNYLLFKFQSSLTFENEIPENSGKDISS